MPTCRAARIAWQAGRLRLSCSRKRVKHAYVYLREALRWRRRLPGSCRVVELKASFSDWQRSLRPGANALTDASPWMTCGAIRFLQGTLRREMRVFEYGAGGWLVLDNAERPHYWRILDALNRAGWPRMDFAGPGPYNAYFWRTCVWQRPT
jgi:hypothetical protein